MRLGRVGFVAVVTAVMASSIAACATAPVASRAPSSSSPAPTDRWQDALLAQPSAVTTAPSLEPGYECHPCHFLAENQLFGVVATGGTTIAVGVQQPPAQAVAFESVDGRRWAPLSGFTAALGTTALAIATNGRRSVIVGSAPTGATSWATLGAGGADWQQAPPQDDLRVASAAGAMTSVTPFAGGFVAGGYRDDPLHATSAAATWRSSDGLVWHADDAAAFADGRIRGVAASGETLVAVGTAGDPNYGPAAAWRWTATTGWQRARIVPDPAGAMRAVIATPSGFVAVGLNGHDDGALAWTSSDGVEWTAAADQPAFHYFSSPVRMQAVLSGPSGLVAAGWRSDAGKGSAVAWTSPDGRTWQGPAWETSFSGGQITGLASSEAGIVAVGRNGYPDWNQAAIWTAVRP
ncbi:MAG TPA: hypothetical protein VFI28_02110 [Candidatus Limnocylindrales bacterium]|nr:hypothetical protein [Candidatus Limnocylindrales bacterium]